MAEISLARLSARSLWRPNAGGMAFVSDVTPFRDYLIAPQGVDSIAIGEVIVPTTYVGTTGLKIKFGWRAGNGLVTGNVVWEVAFEHIIPSSTDTETDTWGTVTVATARACAAGANQVIYTGNDLLVVAAAVGGGTVVAEELVRFRIRRLGFTSATDTLLGPVHILGGVELVGY